MEREHSPPPPPPPPPSPPPPPTLLYSTPVVSATMKINKICSSLIKPLTPTPLNLKNYEISYWDSCQFPMNIAVVLFYKPKPESKPGSESDLHSELEETLAETLVQFYPLAGRFIKKLNSVDCSDQGAEFIQAEAPDLDLASVIGAGQHFHLIPDNYFRVDESADQPLLSIQTTRFSCGGAALAVSVSHRVFDVSSLETFLAAWCGTAVRDKAIIITPLFNLPTLLPILHHTSVANAAPNTAGVFVKEFHFDKGTLASLKSKIGKPVSAVRAVSAVVAKALILLDGAKRRGGGGRCRGFQVIQPVNMRERTTEPVAKHACGNFSFMAVSRRVEAAEAEGISIPELSDLIGEAARRCIVYHAGVASADSDDGREGIIMQNQNECLGACRDPDTNAIMLTDLSKFGFYEVDLGWGKPEWASTVPPRTSNNLTTLMRNKEGDGIEACMRLNPIDMDCFQQDCEFIHKVIYDMCN